MSTTSKLSVTRNKGKASWPEFFLDLGAGRVLSANPDGSDLKTLVSAGRKLPDGLAVDVAAGHLYWTNMGNPKANDGSIFRSDLDGRNMTTIISPGDTFTAKQAADRQAQRQALLVRPRRHGLRVLRAISRIEDRDAGRYEPGRPSFPVRIQTSGAWASPSLRMPASSNWTQKGGANAGEVPHPAREPRYTEGSNADGPHGHRTALRQAARAIDPRLDLGSRLLYWTDRGDPPRGNTLIVRL